MRLDEKVPKLFRRNASIHNGLKDVSHVQSDNAYAMKTTHPVLGVLIRAVSVIFLGRVESGAMTLAADDDDQLGRILSLIGVLLCTNCLNGQNLVLQHQLELTLGYTWAMSLQAMMKTGWQG